MVSGNLAAASEGIATTFAPKKDFSVTPDGVDLIEMTA